MTVEYPAPPIEPDVDLRGLSYMPLFGHHLFGSDFHAACTDAEWRAGLTLWWSAWNQVPAGSLPNNDVVLCRLAEFGKDMRAWKRVREKALHGFELCSDGRLYHGFLVEQARVAWEKRVKERDRKRKWRESRPVSEGEWRELRLAMFRRDGFKCVKCSATEELEADHIVPVDKGGATALSNLQTLCKACNASKRNGEPRRAPSDAFDMDETGTRPGQDRDAADASPLTGIDGTGRDETGRDGTGVVKPLPAAQARPAKKARKAPGTAVQPAEAPTANSATWEAYRSAYSARYGTEPVRNALTNANIAAFVKRVGADEAPLIAAWFLGHKAAKYVANTHHTKLLMQDAESLRTQWATGRQATATAARQADKLGATGDALAGYLGTLQGQQHEA